MLIFTHISAGIRKMVVPDLLSHPGAQPPVNTKCSGLLGCYMLYLPLARAPNLPPKKGASLIPYA